MERDNNNAVKPEHQLTAEAVRNAQHNYSLTQADIARQAGVSSATLSQFLGGQYKGDNEEVSRKLSAWLSTNEKRASMTALFDRARAFTPTLPTSQRITQTLALAQSAGFVSRICGRSGVGKTMTAKHFAETTPSVWYCEFSKDTRTVFATLVEIAEAVGISDIPARQDLIRREIVSRIDRTRGLLICDEAQNLSKDGLDEIRTLHDRAGIGIVFLGDMNLSDKIARLDQLDGRVSAPLTIAHAKTDDVDALLAFWGVDCKRIKTLLRPHAKGRMGLRRIARAFEIASMYAFRESEPITIDHMNKAWNELAGFTEEA